MRVAILSVALMLCSALFLADDHNVDFDKATDFSKFKSFTIREGKINSGRPQLNNSLVIRKIGDAIRTALTSRGLTETSTKPDVIVEFSGSGLEYAVGPGGRANVVGESRGDRGGRGGRGERGQPVDFSEGTLVIDVNTAQPAALIWRGVYHDNEKNSSKLARKFPDDAKKLLSEYPGKKK